MVWIEVLTFFCILGAIYHIPYLDESSEVTGDDIDYNNKMSSSIALYAAQVDRVKDYEYARIYNTTPRNGP